MEFRYQPLSSHEIRLLKPLSHSSNPLSFELIHISLFSKPRYVALSYTWGSPGNTHPVLLNGRRLLIRQNLKNALYQIQSSKLVGQFFWVDAICINQGENHDALNERSAQITLMTQIYEQAASILVWLGKPENEANNRLAFSMMEDFEKRYRHVAKKGRPYRPWWWQHNRPRCCRIFADNFASQGQESIRCAWFSDAQCMAWNRRVVEKPLVDSDLGLPGINDSRALHDSFHSRNLCVATFQQGEVSMW